MIGIIDYGAGNLQSVKNAVEFLGGEAKIIKSPENEAKFDRLILPGVGAFGEAIEKLKASKLDEMVLNFIATNKPFLGICLGMQLLFEKSYEFGEYKGLGVIKGEIVKFDESRFSVPLKIPHVGWNTLEFTRQSPINRGLDKSAYVYFVHSFHAVCDDEFVLAKTHYGYDFVSAVNVGKVYGFQPHPEKSHENGLKILKNFMEL